MISSTSEDYLEAILMIAGNSERSVALHEIATATDALEADVEVTVASLVEEGYLEWTPDDTLRLTERGSVVASKTARKHRILKCFLTEVLGLEERSADREACTIEHGISEETVDRLSSFMGEGACPSCPRSGRRSRCRFGERSLTLLDFEEGDAVRVVMIRRPRRNRRLIDLGVFPGEVVQIRRKLPNLSLVIRVKGCDIAISPGIAVSIVVEPCPQVDSD